MNTASMLLGAALVVLGVLAGAMADRVRYGKTKRERAKTKPDEFWRGEAKTKAELPATHAHERMAADVVAALVQSGYRKAEAVTATRECKGSEQSSLEAWMRAALKRLAVAA